MIPHSVEKKTCVTCIAFNWPWSHISNIFTAIKEDEEKKIKLAMENGHKMQIDAI